MTSIPLHTHASSDPPSTGTGRNSSAGSSVRARAEAELTDEKLAEQAAGGSEWAFAQLVDRYSDRVLGLLIRRAGSRQVAEDLTQEVFLGAWRSLGRYDPSRPFAAWLFTIAVRRAASELRRRGPRAKLESAVTVQDHDVAAGPGTTEADAEAGAELWSLADRVLSLRARTLLWLVYAEDLTPSQAAEVVGMPAVAVRVQLHRARKSLLEAAKSEGIGHAGPDEEKNTQ